MRYRGIVSSAIQFEDLLHLTIKVSRLFSIIIIKSFFLFNQCPSSSIIQSATQNTTQTTALFLQCWLWCWQWNSSRQITLHNRLWRLRRSLRCLVKPELMSRSRAKSNSSATSLAEIRAPAGGTLK